MIKMLFKLVKYSLIIYLMICFKNLYGKIDAVNQTNMININKIYRQEDNPGRDQSVIFAEKMQYYSEENKKKLDEEKKRLKEAQNYVVTSKSYRETLEKGLINP